MKAYKNSKGCILAVFRDSYDTYAVYCRKGEKEYFRRADQRYPCRATRADAEDDMRDIAIKSRDKTWQQIDFRG